MKKEEETIFALTDPFYIAALICFLLENAGKLTEQQIIETVTVNNYVGYFNLSDAFKMIEDKALANLIEKKNGKFFEITEAGVLISREFKNSIPEDVKEVTLNEAKRIKSISELEREFSWGIEKETNGYTFYFRYFDEESKSEIMQVKLNSSSENTAKEILRNFLKNTSDIVGGIMNLMTNGGK